MTLQNHESKECCFKNLREKKGTVKNGKVKNVSEKWGSKRLA